MDNAIQGTKMPTLQVGGVEAPLRIAAALALSLIFLLMWVERLLGVRNTGASLGSAGGRVPGSRRGGRGLATCPGRSLTGSALPGGGQRAVSSNCPTQLTRVPVTRPPFLTGALVG